MSPSDECRTVSGRRLHLGSPECAGSTLVSEALTTWLFLGWCEEGPHTHTLHAYSSLPSTRNNRLFLLLPVLTNLGVCWQVSCSARNQENRPVKKCEKSGHLQARTRERGYLTERCAWASRFGLCRGLLGPCPWSEGRRRPGLSSQLPRRGCGF